MRIHLYPKHKHLTLRGSFVLVSLVTLLFSGTSVHAISQSDLNSINSNTPFFNPSETACSDSTTAALTSSTTGGTVNASDVQAGNAKIIIGIAKTENLGQAGALIGLMVGLTESGLKVDANQNVPLSENNPNKQGDGNDHDSLGVFQQRISSNWSTISTDPNNAAAVDQLMNAAYNAEAFFGSPPGSNAPSALSKGLQNVSGWQAMEPWIAAQTVQNSGHSDGSNYHDQLDTAQSLLNQYYDSSPAVPLPVPLSGGTGGGGQDTVASSAATDTCSVSSGSGSVGPVQGSIVQTAVNLAWDDVTYPSKGAVDTADCYNGGVAINPPPSSCHHGFQQEGVHDPVQYTTPTFQAVIKQGLGVDNYNFTDCGSFVSAVMHSSGVDPNYPMLTSGYQRSYMLSHPEKYTQLQNPTTAQLQPGDIFVNDGHTYIYVGKQADGFSVAEGSQDNHSPEIDNLPYFSNFGQPFTVMRVKG